MLNQTHVCHIKVRAKSHMRIQEATSGMMAAMEIGAELTTEIQRSCPTGEDAAAELLPSQHV